MASPRRGEVWLVDLGMTAKGAPSTGHQRVKLVLERYAQAAKEIETFAGKTTPAIAFWSSTELPQASGSS